MLTVHSLTVCKIMMSEYSLMLFGQYFIYSTGVSLMCEKKPGGDAGLTPLVKPTSMD